MTTSLAPKRGSQLSSASIGHHQFESKHQGENNASLLSDQSGSVVMGATVVVTNAATGIKQTIKTDQDGVFTFPFCPSGKTGSM
jgi:hypothetical protein